MDKFARRQWFERLCELRDAYGRLGQEDTTSVISIDAMVEHARELLIRAESPLVAIVDQDRPAA